MALSIFDATLKDNTVGADFWDFEQDPEQTLANQIATKLEPDALSTILPKLHFDEITILIALLLHNNTISKRELKNLIPQRTQAFPDEALQKLISKYIIYERKTLSSFSQKDYLYLMYDEMFQILTQLTVSNLDGLLHYSKEPFHTLNHKQYSRVQQILLHKCQGIIPIWLKEYFQETTTETLRFFFGRRVIPVYPIALSYTSASLEEPTHVEQYGLTYLAGLYHVYSHFYKNVVTFTKRRTLHKEDYTKLGAIFQYSESSIKQEFKQWNKWGWFREKHDMLKPSDSFDHLIKQSLMNQYQTLLEHRPEVLEYIPFIREQRNQWFHSADIDKARIETCWRNQMDDLQKTMEIDSQENLDWLHELGFLERAYSNESPYYRSSSVFWQYIYRRGFENTEEISEQSFVLGDDYTITVEPNRATPFQLYLLDVFCESITKDVVYTYKITKTSLQDAVHIGLNPDPFITMLKRSSQAAQSLLFNIQEWIQKIRTVSLKHILVLESDDETIEEIWTVLESKIASVKRLGRHTIQVDDKIPKVYQLLSKEYYIQDKTETYDK